MATAEPRTKKGRATRDRILEAASMLVFEHGVAGTTLDDVRAAANVSKGQLYHYFAEKHVADEGRADTCLRGRARIRG